MRSKNQQREREALLERARLLRRCQRLLIQISFKPSFLKLLKGTEQALMLFAQYKTGRKHVHPKAKELE